MPPFALEIQKAGGWLEYMRDHMPPEALAQAVEAETLNTASTAAGHGHAGQPE